MITTRRQRRENMKRLAIGSAVAGVFGYVAGILTAPQSGKDTRKDIKDNADKGIAEVEKDLKKVQAELDKALSEAKSRGSKLRGRTKDELNDLSGRATESKEKVQELLSSVRDGKAKDKDLDKAVKQANSALDNLKKYLKK